jgi:hypothetical protein
MQFARDSVQLRFRRAHFRQQAVTLIFAPGQFGLNPLNLVADSLQLA